MKKAFVLLLALGMSLPLFASCERRIKIEQLPEPAREFIYNHFNDSEISRIEREKEHGQYEYTVRFKDRAKIEFDQNGRWKNIENHSSPIPADALPQRIKEYIDGHHAGADVREIERDNRGFEVKLTNGAELQFDLAYNFIKYD